MKYSEAYGKVNKRLAESGRDMYEAAAEEKLLREYVSGLGPADWFLKKNSEIPAEEIERLDEILARLLKNEPIDYIIGKRWFCGLEFELNSETLIPRQETELLAEEAAGFLATRIDEAKASNGEISVFDLCTGSGCIIISIAKLLEDKNKAFCKEKITFSASDISGKALEAARNNAAKHEVKVDFLEGSLFEVFADRKPEFDLIVSNPPYIPAAQMEELEEKVAAYEPHRALYGGEDGLDFYRIIAKDAKKYLKKNGMLLLEIGFDEGESVSALLEKEDYENISVKKDYAGLDRIVAAFVKHRD